MLAVVSPVIVVVLVALGLSSLHSRLRPLIASRMLLILLVIGAFAALPVIFNFVIGALFEIPFFGSWMHDGAHVRNFHVDIGGTFAIIVLCYLTYLLFKLIKLNRSYRSSRFLSTSEIVVVEHENPFAFVTPGLNGEITISSALVEMLSPSELQIVVAHETAHRQGRHDRILLIGNICIAIVPFMRFVLRRLEFSLERIADDCAAKFIGSRKLVARTLTRVALSDNLPALTMGISKVGVAARIVALTNESGRMTQRNLAMLWALVFSLLPLTLLQWHHVVESLRMVCGL